MNQIKEALAMNEIQTKLLVQSLKGSKAQILWAFFFAMSALDVDQVIAWTGLKRETCYHALESLSSVHLLGCQKLEHGRKLWLLGSEMLPLLDDLFARLGDGSELIISGQESEKRTPGATTTTIKLRELKNKLNDSVVVVDSGAGVRKTDSWKNGEALGLAALSNTEEKAIWRICEKIGIGEPTRTRIALETDYPPESIWAHGLYGRDQGLNIPLIVHRIRMKDWLPENIKIDARESVNQFFDDETDGKP